MKRPVVMTSGIDSPTATWKAEVSSAALKAAFRQWLDEAGPAVPIRIRDVSDNGISFGFEGYTAVLDGWIGQRDGHDDFEMLIAAEYKGIWDGLTNPDLVYPEPRPGGWVCATCEREGRASLFPTAKAVWRDHLFDRLTKWIADCLVPATYLGFYRDSDNGVSWVDLLKEESADATYVIPLRND
jgi:hypothetical protein